jgi:hypothetical protein
MTDQLDGLPKTIRIGPYDITIKLLPGDHDDCGNFNLGEGAIGLQGAFHTPTMAVDTFIHEVIHAACRIYGIIDDDFLEERICSGVAPVMTQIFLDHPEILRWMLKSLEPSATSPTI